MGPGENALVFIVGNDTAVLRSLQFIIQVQGFSVRAYHSSSQLLRTASWPTQGCLVIEQNMPDMAGLDLLAALRARGVRLPAILTTSHPTPELQRRAARTGVLRVLGKPLAHDVFLEILRDAVRQPNP